MKKLHHAKILADMKRFYESNFKNWRELYENFKQANRHCALRNKYFLSNCGENFRDAIEIKIQNPLSYQHMARISRTDPMLQRYINGHDEASFQEAILPHWKVKHGWDENFVVLQKSNCNNASKSPKAIRLLIADRFESPYRLSENNILPYYLLDMASLLPVLSLDILPDDRVLDMCAAPGGKTLAIMQQLSLKGQHVCNDVTKRRYNRLNKVVNEYIPYANKLGKNITITNWTGELFGTEEKQSFDKVLVDAPCSSERHVIQKDFQYGGWSIKKMKDNAKLQVKLLFSAVQAVKRGGIVVYSTCSISPLENDAVVSTVINDCQQNGMLVCVDTFSLQHSSIDRFPVNTFNVIETQQGILVIPTEQCNWGPMYISRIFRIT